MQGSGTHSAPMQSSPIQGAQQPPVYIQPAYVAPSTVMAGPVHGAQVAPPAPMGAYQPVGTYDTGIPCGTGQCGGGAGFASAFSEPSYSAPSFASPTAAVSSGGRQRNRVIGARGLFFSRNYGNSRQLSYNDAGDALFSADASHGSFGGFEGFLASRGRKGAGWEARYFGLFPSDARAEIFGSPGFTTTTLRGLQDLHHPNAAAGVGANVFDVKNLAVRQTLTRSTDIDSIEFNFLRNAGSSTHHGRSRSHEFLAGFRYFQFDEDLRFDSFLDQPDFPSQLTYDIGTQNTLLGFQLGSRTERCITRRLSLTTGTKVGLFNNRTRVNQRIFDNAGNFSVIGSGPDTGTNYDFRDERNNLAVLGELDLGLIYQITCRSRVNFGYRAIGVSGVALADDQIPNNFKNLREISEVDDSGSLILQGGYAGVEFSY